MKLHELKPAPGSRKSRKRVGRGMAAGKEKPPAGDKRAKGPFRRRRTSRL